MKLKRTISIIVILLATLACQIEGDPCARLCAGKEGEHYTTCYQACEGGK